VEESCTWAVVAVPAVPASVSAIDDAARTQRERYEGIRVANIKSQLKRIRTNEAARLRNKSVKSALKTAIRKFREAAEAGDKEKAVTLLQEASRKLDKAASKGVIHPNQAANKKSAMAKKANAL
jgi:small subunit ribosomal protein S20